MASERKSKILNLICPRTKRFEGIFVCAANCRHHCSEYRKRITLQLLERFVEEHPIYEIRGELMAVGTSRESEKKYWVIVGDNQYEEVSEEDLTQKPQIYLGKEIWDKPPNKYELIVTLRKVKES